MNKPNGQTFLKPDKEEILKFMNKLDIRKVPSIGRMTELILNKLGIIKCPDIIENATEVMLTFKEKQAQFLIRSSLGIARCYHH